MPCRPGLEAKIQPPNIRRYLLVKRHLVDLDEGRRVLRLGRRARIADRGVIWSAPNWTVSSTATSNEMIRPVILSSPAKIAVGFLILSAWAGVPANAAAASATPRMVRFRRRGGSEDAMVNGMSCQVGSETARNA